ncbi:glycosyltransferase family 2 protein [Salinibacter ruber]|uniref:glycosyltransferase family 2 protein n=1 Tax=Salinibacter ruber TaxID=146919 RepID=UPI0024510513|nr:glycosyltransferase involved in cell wall biosynthesis [Salinibacter ruber]
MADPKPISVCIPTCDRPEYVQDAIQSALQQNPDPFEILIGDDSSDQKTAQLTRRYKEEGAPIRHLRNQPSLGQAKNVDLLYREADGDYIVLLHDDDRLLNGALDTLLSCFEKHSGIVGAFGKQQIVDSQGSVKTDETRRLNEGYHRTDEHVGLQSSSLWSAIVGQFPNDGYMVQASTAKQVGYLHDAGDACDYAFNVAFAEATDGDFFFENTFTSQYRWSEESIVRGSGTTDTAYQAMKIASQRLPDEIMCDPAVRERLRSLAPAAIMQAADLGHPEQGLQWFFSPYYRKRIFSPRGLWRLSKLIYSYITRSVTTKTK